MFRCDFCIIRSEQRTRCEIEHILFPSPLTLQAQQTYLQEHMNVPGYLSSKECELADNLTMAYSANDIEKLDKAKHSPEMHYLDYEVQRLSKELSIFDDIYTADVVADTNSKMSAAAVPAPAPAASTSLFAA